MDKKCLFIMVLVFFVLIPSSFAEETSAQAKVPVVDQTVKCPKCGYTNKKEDRYCLNCAAELRPMTEEEKKKKEEIAAGSLKRDEEMKRIAEKEKLYRKKQADEELKEKSLTEGKITLGLTQEEVARAWGDPTKVINEDDGKIIWKYTAVKIVTLSPTRYYKKEELLRYVTFVNGVVADFKILAGSEE
jgi:hypothetical protein